MAPSIIFLALAATAVVPGVDTPILQLEPNGYNTKWTDVPPPLRFIGDVTVTVEFTSDIKGRCKATPPEGMRIAACYFPWRRVMVLPQPCPAAINDRFSSLACHEIGHANGWGTLHEE